MHKTLANKYLLHTINDFYISVKHLYVSGRIVQFDVNRISDNLLVQRLDFIFKKKESLIFYLSYLLADYV